jgi:chemotaxis protein MotB
MQRPIYQNRFNGEQAAPFRTKWLTTFNDMITLLMVFFVLLFSMGSLDLAHFKTFQNALQSAMGVLHPGEHAPIGIISKDGENSASPANSADIDEDAGDHMNQLKDTQGLEAQYTQKGIHLTLDDNLLFNSGSDRLTDQGHDLLDKVVSIIAPLKHYIRVEGHTDNVPIATNRFPSNWELSTARAVRVVKYMQSSGVISPQSLSAAGYGASKPRVANDSEQNRSKNRRVEIILQHKAPSYLVK